MLVLVSTQLCTYKTSLKVQTVLGEVPVGLLRHTGAGTTEGEALCVQTDGSWDGILDQENSF